jgi:hypothetical protein
MSKLLVLAALLTMPDGILATRAVRRELLARKPSFGYTAFTRPGQSNALDHRVSLDGPKLRVAVKHRRITGLRLIASTPGESGAWHGVELRPDPSYRDLQTGVRLDFARTVQLPQGLSPALRYQLDRRGAAYRAEVTTSDGKTTVFDLQDPGVNLLPNNRGWVGSPADR